MQSPIKEEFIAAEKRDWIKQNQTTDKFQMGFRITANYTKI